MKSSTCWILAITLFICGGLIGGAIVHNSYWGEINKWKTAYSISVGVFERKLDELGDCE